MRSRALIRFGIRSAAAVTTVVILAAPSADAGSLADIRERGELVMACFPRQASHFVRVNLEKGAMPREGTTDHFQGIDVDLMAAFAAELGVSLTIRPITEPGYGKLIPALLAGRADVIASSFTVTPEREEQVDFTIPYFVTHRIVVVRKESRIASVEDLAGQVGAVAQGTSLVDHMRRLGVAEERIHFVDFSRDTYLAVAEGEADFALVEDTSAPTLLAETPGLKVAFRLPGEDQYAIAVAPGSELLEPLNRFLAKLRDSGELEGIIRRYISTYEQEQVIPQPEESSSTASCASVCRLGPSGRVPPVKVAAAAAC